MPQNWQNVSVTLKYRDEIGRNISKDDEYDIML